MLIILNGSKNKLENTMYISLRSESESLKFILKVIIQLIYNPTNSLIKLYNKNYNLLTIVHFFTIELSPGLTDTSNSSPLLLHLESC